LPAFLMLGNDLLQSGDKLFLEITSQELTTGIGTSDSFQLLIIL
jgi:hypothetical protein